MNSDELWSMLNRKWEGCKEGEIGNLGREEERYWNGRRKKRKTNNKIIETFHKLGLFCYYFMLF